MQHFHKKYHTSVFHFQFQHFFAFLQTRYHIGAQITSVRCTHFGSNNAAQKEHNEEKQNQVVNHTTFVLESIYFMSL